MTHKCTNLKPDFTVLVRIVTAKHVAWRAALVVAGRSPFHDANLRPRVAFSRLPVQPDIEGWLTAAAACFFFRELWSLLTQILFHEGRLQKGSTDGAEPPPTLVADPLGNRIQASSRNVGAREENANSKNIQEQSRWGRRIGDSELSPMRARLGPLAVAHAREDPHLYLRFSWPQGGTG